MAAVVAASGVYLLVVLLGLLYVVGFFCYGALAQGVRPSVVVMHGFSCCT